MVVSNENTDIVQHEFVFTVDHFLKSLNWAPDLDIILSDVRSQELESISKQVLQNAKCTIWS